MPSAQKSKIFVNNLNIPQELNFDAEKVYINKIGDVLIMTPVNRLAETLERGAAIIAEFADDFMKDAMPEEIPAVREKL